MYIYLYRYLFIIGVGLYVCVFGFFKEYIFLGVYFWDLDGVIIRYLFLVFEKCEVKKLLWKIMI